MVSMGYSIGGEQSGHIIFLDHNTTGDGLLTALQLLAVVKETGKKLSDLASFMKELPQVLVNAKVKNENKDKYMKDEAIAGMITGLEKKLKGRGRVLIRPSGTEPLIRVMLEGANETEIKEDAEALAKLIEEKLN